MVTSSLNTGAEHISVMLSTTKDVLLQNQQL